MSEKPRIFISYAHRDGSSLALYLYEQLTDRGYDVWLDRHRLTGGDRWSVEIEYALDRATIVLALLSDASYISDLCRAEQYLSVVVRKRLIPILVHAHCHRPPFLFNLQFIDFSDSAKGPPSLTALLRSFNAPHTVTTSSLSQPRYCNAPALPNNYVARSGLLARLCPGCVFR